MILIFAFCFAAFLYAMENTKKFLDPEGGEVLKYGDEIHTGHTLKKDQLLVATQEHWKIEYLVTKIETLSTEPFQHCFICAETEREKMNNGKFSWLFCCAALIFY